MAVHFSIKWVAIGNVGYGLLYMAINAYYLRKTTGIGPSELSRAIAKSIGVTLLCNVPALLVTNLPAMADKPSRALAAGLATGGIAWCISVTLLQHPIVKELLLLLNELRRSARRVA